MSRVDDILEVTPFQKYTDCLRLYQYKLTPIYAITASHVVNLLPINAQAEALVSPRGREMLKELHRSIENYKFVSSNEDKVVPEKAIVKYPGLRLACG